MTFENCEQEGQTVSRGESANYRLYDEAYDCSSGKDLNLKLRATGEPYPYPSQTDFPPQSSSSRDPYKYQDGNIYP